MKNKSHQEINPLINQEVEEMADDEDSESRKVDTEAGKKRSELVNKKSQASTSQDMINHAKEKAAVTMNKWKRILGLEQVDESQAGDVAVLLLSRCQVTLLHIKTSTLEDVVQ